MRSWAICRLWGSRRRTTQATSLLLVLMLVLSVVLSGFAIPQVLAQDSATGEMPIYRGNAARTGALPGPGPDISASDFGQLWSREVFPSPADAPIVVDGTIYQLGQYHSKLVVMDVVTGWVHWTFDFGQGIGQLTVADGVVFVMGEYSFWAIDAATGQQKWKSPIPGNHTESG